MAYIAKLRERKKAYKMSLKQLEAFHKPDIHKYWNKVIILTVVKVVRIIVLYHV